MEEKNKILLKRLLIVVLIIVIISIVATIGIENYFVNKIIHNICYRIIGIYTCCDKI